MTSRKKLIVLIVVLAIFWIIASALLKFITSPQGIASIELAAPSTIDISHVQIGGTVITAETVVSEANHNSGLSGRDGLNAGTGMLFVFEKPALYGFWMKDMHFPIDIVWLDENYKITTIKESVKPSSYPTVFYPLRPSKYTLEVSDGTAKMNNWKVGDIAKILP